MHENRKQILDSHTESVSDENITSHRFSYFWSWCLDVAFTSSWTFHLVQAGMQNGSMKTKMFVLLLFDNSAFYVQGCV